VRPACAREGAGRAGFTLLEVLVAVGVLGLLYTVLAGLAVQGLRAEGESARELRASLLADRALAEIETGGDLRVAPPVEREEEEFVVAVEVAPFELELPPSTLRERSEARREPTGSLIQRGRGTQAPALRRIDVSVRWSEGVFEREVRRTSFALDPEAAAPLLESLAASQEAREQAGEDEPADDEEAGGDAAPTTGTRQRSGRGAVPAPDGGDE
jgi:prepilin-type N-terminal cleavage/methylation domain-containing protein